MANISRNARRPTNIIQRETADVRVELQQQRQRLADSSTGAEDGDFGVTGGRGGERARGEGRRDGAEGGAGEHSFLLWMCLGMGMGMGS